jgi:hypothetical protein
MCFFVFASRTLRFYICHGSCGAQAVSQQRFFIAMSHTIGVRFIIPSGVVRIWLTCLSLNT